MQYKSYEIQISSDCTYLRDSLGKIIGKFESDSEAREYVDDLGVESEDEFEDKIEYEHEDLYYIYRIAKLDQDKYSNYQYYNGRRFLYNSANIQYFTKKRAEDIIKYYKQKDDYCNYYIAKKGTR